MARRQTVTRLELSPVTLTDALGRSCFMGLRPWMMSTSGHHAGTHVYACKLWPGTRSVSVPTFVNHSHFPD